MKQFNKSIATLGFFTLLATSCTNGNLKNNIAETLEENPDLVFKAIEKNPDRFLEVVQKAAQGAQKRMADKRQEAESQALDQAFENPLEPKLSKEDATLGPNDAPITIVEYSDFECPFCRKGYQTINELREKYKGKIKLVYKHLPLSFHPQAMISAKYFEAIKMQSESLAFKFHDKIFENQSELRNGEKFLKKIAKNLNVNMSKLKKDLGSEKIEAKIKEDIAEAKKFGIQGTPGFVINGIPVKGAYPASHFDQIISKLQSKNKLKL